MTQTTQYANGMPPCDPPMVFKEPPEYPPEGETVYIPHMQRNGVKANQWSMAFTIKRTGNTDEYIPCNCKWCYEAWSRSMKR